MNFVNNVTEATVGMQIIFKQGFCGKKKKVRAIFLHKSVGVASCISFIWID